MQPQADSMDVREATTSSSEKGEAVGTRHATRRPTFNLKHFIINTVVVVLITTVLQYTFLRVFHGKSVDLALWKNPKHSAHCECGNLAQSPEWRGIISDVEHQQDRLHKLISEMKAREAASIARNARAN
jgi:hypothetical protein